MGNVFFTADPHFDHANIIRHANRPFANVDEMNSELIANWNDTVHGGDHVYILGDFAWKNHAHFIHALHGKKYLITGSHDRMSVDCLRLFTEVHEGMLIRNFNNNVFCMTHCAMLVWEKSHYGAINLHGHSHGRITEYDDRRRMDVGMDIHAYRPISLEFILFIMQKRTYGIKGGGDEVQKNVILLQERNKKLLEEFNAQANTRPNVSAGPDNVVAADSQTVQSK